MSRQAYTYSPALAAPRHSANHGTSSAFSSSANPDEDWTQISDLAERRRIQNRIAQRNYRKKLKRRLEDLERRAGSSSESPPQVHAELRQPERKNQNYKQANNGSNTRQKLSPRVLSHNQFTPPMNHEDDIFSSGFDRDGSHTPPLFSYQSYPPPEESIYPPYPSYRPITTTSGSYSEYMSPPPMALPSMMHFTDAIKRESMGLNDDALNPFSMSYAAMAGIDIQGPNAYEDSNPHVNTTAFPLIRALDRVF